MLGVGFTMPVGVVVNAEDAGLIDDGHLVWMFIETDVKGSLLNFCKPANDGC
jgi:hypothetical protein